MRMKIKRRAKSMRLHIRNTKHSGQPLTAVCSGDIQSVPYHDGGSRQTNCRVRGSKRDVIPAVFRNLLSQLRSLPTIPNLEQRHSRAAIFGTKLLILTSHLQTCARQTEASQCCSFRFMQMWMIEGYRISKQRATRSAR
jgi:hypothetical protein